MLVPSMLVLVAGGGWWWSRLGRGGGRGGGGAVRAHVWNELRYSQRGDAIEADGAMAHKHNRNSL